MNYKQIRQITTNPSIRQFIFEKKKKKIQKNLRI
jgi:hypothetical protein